uniref:Uncharacterized protein n=1 Tax=Human herpesvirus 2 TaxID=10310 RepID=A0A481TAL0_HHV2|nr:hypothetical protein [Human alphaherpesvirus 2]
MGPRSIKSSVSHMPWCWRFFLLSVCPALGCPFCRRYHIRTNTRVEWNRNRSTFIHHTETQAKREGGGPRSTRPGVWGRTCDDVGPV